ncbi:hypothetical protein [Streptomyces gibsoniae]|uniref:TfoX N-terminal domain-containing protein n=1 Tax=Streptomyces gibsoniae TaxID=3075529 RepID=A0ABU2U074_9ACTN|nr:hypothetical protein [Streptomyces sp. DSM 41699]MDT0466456.1 hypothetical protein [Streptomyces sp. DSM 41699]
MTAAEHFDRLVTDLADRGVARAAMFGKTTLQNRHGKAFAVQQPDALVFRLIAGSPAFEQALALPGAAVFEPAPGRAMKDWIAVPEAHADHYPRLAEAALDALG